MSVLLCISATRDDAARLTQDGPRRDFVELSRATGGETLYRADRPRRRGLLGRLFGPHVRQAWAAARRAHRGDTVFADGEHIGIPLCLFLMARMRAGVRVVMLGHLVDRPWKRLPMAVLSRCGPASVLIVHSVTQEQRLRHTLGRRWRLESLPYQVDTAFWQANRTPDAANPVLLAVGSEHRDYETLVEAVRGLPVHLKVAAGSHWARSTAGAASLPPNVEYIDRPLPFAELRAAYESATAVVVPLEDVTNQSGVTSILEAMSMSRPVITTANRGQRECIVGPVVRRAGSPADVHDVVRGPVLFGRRQGAQSGFYTPTGDSESLRDAICLLLDDPALCRRLGEEGRTTACASFELDRFIDALARLITADTASDRALAAAR